MTVCAIHQPNFVPWLPYFQKMAEADVFVFLTHCQFEKGGYQNRFKLHDQWYTMPIYRGLEPLAGKRYMEARLNYNKIAAALPQHRVLANMRGLVSGSLAHTNMGIVKYLAGKLKINTEIVEDWDTGQRATARLVEICKGVGANEYLSGPSGPSYMDMPAFAMAGIKVRVLYHADRRHTLEVVNGR